ncbi:galactokinase family protein [Gaetbulibacter aquiaggeris]|uniref:Galactokinase family protein n=1 Tax=Gaetbulibacter aquiaggeris TaxID=1735373 RepID=A0ABW7MWB1_9FLAO
MKKNNKIIKILSPGRTCLFGDHQDYLGLPVIACAINKYISLNAFENSFSVFKIQLPDIGEERLIDIYDDFKHLEKRDYFASSLKVLKRYGCIPDRGFDITITGDLPINAGLSSSSALIIAWIRFLLEAFGSTYETTVELIARMAYEAEVLEHKEPGGIMDQYTISMGNVLFINTSERASFEIIQKNMDGLIVGESGIKKETINTLGNRKDNALKAIEYVKLKNPEFEIKSAILEEYKDYEKDIPFELRPYFFAALKNHSITLKAFNEFKKEKPNLRYLGTLMNEHHLVLKDILKITVPLIDQMVSKAIQAGAYGVKIVGSGGGGSIVAVAPLEKEQKVIEAINNAGGKAAYKVNVDMGARLMD